MIQKPIDLAGSGCATASASDLVACKSDVPLVVDLDSTLISTDTLIESCFLLAKKNPLKLFRLPLWLAHGRARLKERVAQEVTPDAHTLPYHSEFLKYLRAEKQQGRTLILATGADEKIAWQVAVELGLFDAVYASDGVTNLSGDQKRRRLVEEFGFRGFDYAGSNSRDSVVWTAARQAILVSPRTRLRNATAQQCAIARVFEGGTPTGAMYLHALRPHHWLKSALVFLPLIVAHQLYNPALLVHAILAFVALSLCASSVYLLNDLFDLADDRRHPHKKQRMLASGQLPISHAVMLIPMLLSSAVLVSLVQPFGLLLTLGTYFFLMLAYCLKLRNLVAFDALVLAAGYTLRVVAGSVAVDISVSRWLLAAVFCLFLGLALLKRYAELVSLRSYGHLERVRGYSTDDTAALAISGCASSYLAVLVGAFYVAAEPRFYSGYFSWLFLILLLYWITRMWRMASRGDVNGDPVTFALNDQVSRVLGILVATILLVTT